MVVTATELKTRFSKILELVSQEEIIVTKNGKQVAKLVAINEPSAPNVEGLLSLLGKQEKDDGMCLEQMREERFNK